jgi:hypothetical protein
MPAVVLITTSTPPRSRSITLAVERTSREPSPLLGSRTCTCTTAAPALAAAMPDSAICCGVTGTCSDLPTVSPAPVSAHVMMTLRFTVERPLPLWRR